MVSLRRYPIKSMGGEPLTSVDLDRRGLIGDRWFAVVDEDGRLASGKTTRRFRRRDRVFDYAASTSPAGEVVVSGPDGVSWPVGDPALDAELTRATGDVVAVRPESGVPHQDGGSVSLVGTATLEWCAAHLGVDADPRRLRVNVVLSTEVPFVEESWVGSPITLGGCVLRVVAPVPRCRTIDLAQDGVAGTTRWLGPLGARRDALAAVYADVVTPGQIAVGDILRATP